MKEEYDFSAATRGRFSKPGANLVSPVHLEPDVFDYLDARARSQGMSLSGLINELLKKDIELIEAAK